MLAIGVLSIVAAVIGGVFAKNALAAVRQRGTSILGVVVNGITTDHPAYYYNYYYHAYYSDNQTKNIDPATSRPATKMAVRRSTRANSIQAEALAHAAENATAPGSNPAASEKIEEFKIRRTVRTATASQPEATAPVEPVEPVEPDRTTSA